MVRTRPNTTRIADHLTKPTLEPAWLVECLESPIWWLPERVSNTPQQPPAMWFRMLYGTESRLRDGGKNLPATAETTSAVRRLKVMQRYSLQA